MALILGLYTQALPYVAELYPDSLAPKWGLVFIAVAFPVFLLEGATPTLLSRPLVWWSPVVALLAGLHPATGVPQDETRAAILSLLSSCYYYGASVVLFAHADARRTALWTLKLALVLGSVSCLLEFFGLLTFGISFSTGRAAGLYVNPNTAAIVLTLGLATILPYLSQPARLTYFAVVGSGVLVTWSRMGYLGLAGLFVVAVLAGRLSVGPATLARRLSVAMVGVATAAVVIYGLEASQPESLQTADVEFRRNPFAQEASTDRDTRLGVWQDAVDGFMAAPVFGLGFLSFRSLTLHAQGPHNMALTFAAEFGLVGLALLAALGLGIWRQTREDALLRVGYLCFASMFNHNILDYPATWIVIAIWGAMPAEGGRGVVRLSPVVRLGRWRRPGLGQ